jgi:gluconolactonase
MNGLALDQLSPVASGLDHPEGVALGPDGLLYAGGEAGQIYRLDLTGGQEQIADTAGSLLGVCLDAAGVIYACDPGNRAVMRVDPRTGELDRWCESAGGVPLAVPNWAAFDPDGSLWLSDSGTEQLSAVDGRLLRVPPGGGDAEVLDIEPLHFPNGLCIGPDGRVCWLESFTPRLRRLTDAGPELIAALPGVVPDGVALDADGGYTIACYYPFRLLRVGAGAEVTLLLDDPHGIHIPMPTNVAFFGEGLTRMAIACLGGTQVVQLPAPAPGTALIYP